MFYFIKESVRENKDILLHIFTKNIVNIKEKSYMHV